MAASSTTGRCGWTSACSTSWSSSPRWHRCTSRTTWRRFASCCCAPPTFRRWPASTPPFIARRFGFHGLSYEFIASQLPALDPDAARGRTVVLHLGDGASMCALLDGKSVATTMGFASLDGLLMGTRCGALDPGVVLYLMESQ